MVLAKCLRDSAIVDRPLLALGVWELFFGISDRLLHLPFPAGWIQAWPGLDYLRVPGQMLDPVDRCRTPVIDLR